ncbi:hypothetical protein [Mucilaginibacter terrenus]|nr:hypothetical protein [Mucilaginibacter terrenus]
MLKGLFSGEVLAEFPFTQKTFVFTATKPSVCAVWQKGKLFSRTPIDKFNIRVTKEAGGESVSLTNSFFSPHVNGLDTARLETLRFYAEPGDYRLTLEKRNGTSFFEQLFSRLFPDTPVDYSKYSIQVRESRPVYYIIAAIPLFTLSVFCVVGGIVAGFAAPNILTDMGILYT